MATNGKVLCGQLAASASAAIAFLGSYGRAFGQAASNCVLQPDGVTYLCSGETTTAQVISLSGTANAVTTGPGFSVNAPDTEAYPDAIFITQPVGETGAISFTDNNASVLNARRGLDVLGRGPISITSNGSITGRNDYGILATMVAGSTGDISINAADVTGRIKGINAVNNGSGGITISSSGTVNGGIAATLAPQSNADLSIQATNVTGDIIANNQGSGSVTVTTSGITETISNVRAFAAYGDGAVNVNIAGAVSGYLNAFSDTGAINITASGAVSGAGIHANSTTGAITIHSSSAESTTQVEAQAIYGGTASITVDGAVDRDVGIINGQQKAGQGDSTIAINSAANVTGGVFVYAYGPGHTSVTVAGSVSGNADPGLALSNTIVIATPNDAASVSDIAITSSGTVDGVIRINDQPYLKRDFSGPSSSYGAATVTNAGKIAGVVSNARSTITNTGTITSLAESNAIELGGGNSVVNLRGGSVSGDVVFLQRALDEGATTLNWESGALAGGISFGSSDAAVAGKGTVVANLSGLGESDLAGTTHVRSSATDSTLNIANMTLRGGTFDADDAARGVNLGWKMDGAEGAQLGWKAINLSSGAALELTGDLTVQNLRLDTGSTLRIAASSPTISGAVVNDGTINLTGQGTVGNTTRIANSFTQGAGGNLIVGVTPTAIDLLNVGSGATLAGKVTFAWAPGTYAEGSRPFLSTDTGSITGTFSSIATASGTTAPSGYAVSVTYAATSASLSLQAGTTPPDDTTPETPVIAPTDGQLFSEQITGFMASNEVRAIGLLGRTQADGGGNSFFNPEIGEARRARFWMEGTGHTLGANAFRASSAGAQFGGDVTLGATGRVGLAFAYERSWLDDTAGGTGRGNNIHASVYASQPIGSVGLSASFTYSHASMKARRPTGAGIADANRDLTGLTAAVQISAPIAVRGALLTPAIGVVASRLEADAFHETGGGLPGFAVAGLDRDKSFVSPFASIGLSYALSGRGGVTWVPDAEIGYRRSSVARGVDTVLIAEDGTVFAGNRIALDRNVIRAGASLSAHKGRWTAYVRYRAEVSNASTGHGGVLGMRLAL